MRFVTCLTLNYWHWVILIQTCLFIWTLPSTSWYLTPPPMYSPNQAFFTIQCWFHLHEFYFVFSSNWPNTSAYVSPVRQTWPSTSVKGLVFYQFVTHTIIGVTIFLSVRTIFINIKWRDLLLLNKLLNLRGRRDKNRLMRKGKKLLMIMFQRIVVMTVLWRDHTSDSTLLANSDEYETVENPDDRNYLLSTDGHIKWFNDPIRKSSQTCNRDIITKLPGLKSQFQNIDTVYDAFSIFFNGDIINLIAQNTNMYIDSIKLKYKMKEQLVRQMTMK